MKRLHMLSLVLLFPIFSFSQGVGDIIITEIMKNPNAVSDAYGEYFEVYNTTNADINLQGWIISDMGTSAHTIATAVIVPSNGYAVLGRNADTAINGGVTVNYQYSSFILSNTSDSVILTFSGIEIDRVDYDSGATFPNSTGASMELSTNKYDSVSNDSGANWAVATTAYGAGDLGTPGSVNSVTLSVESNQLQKFVLYPNPVTEGKLTINTITNTKKTLKIYNMFGEDVFSKQGVFDKPVDISSLTSGIYLVEILEEGRVAFKKLIID